MRNFSHFVVSLCCDRALNTNFYNFHPCFCAGKTKPEKKKYERIHDSTKCIAFYHAIIECIEFACCATNGYFWNGRQQIHIRFTWATNGNISHCNRNKTKTGRRERRKNSKRISIGMARDRHNASHFTGNKNRFFFRSSFRLAKNSNRWGLTCVRRAKWGRQFVLPTHNTACVERECIVFDTTREMRHEIFISFGMWMSAVCRRNSPRAPNSLINQSKRKRKKAVAFSRTNTQVRGSFFAAAFGIDRMASGGGQARNSCVD